MNKKTLRIAGWALGLSAAVAGIGVTVGLTQKTSLEAEAASLSTDLKAVTSLISGKQYVIVGGNDNYALPTQPTLNSGKIDGTSIASVPSNASGYLWTFTKSGNYWLIGDGYNYIYHSNGGNSGTNLAYGTDQDTFPWSLTYSDSAWTFAGVNNNTVKTRGMLCNGGTGVFGGYALSNAGSYGAMTIYEVATTPQTITGDTSGYVGNGVSLTTNADSAEWTITENTASATLSAASGKSITVNATSVGSVTVQAVAAGYTTVTHTIAFAELPAGHFIIPSTSTVMDAYTGQNGTISISYGNLESSLSVAPSNSKVSASIQNDDGAGSAEVKISYLEAGSAEVYLKDGDTTLSTITVTVTASAVSITGLAASDSVYIGENLDLGSTISVEAVGVYSSDVTWESDDESVATVNSSGVVTGVSDGVANITVTSDDYPGATMTCTVTVSEAPIEGSFDFRDISGFSSWGSSYSKRIVSYDEGTVTFASANKQGSTITDMPVTKGGDVSFVAKDGFYINEASFVCKKWDTKTQTITLHYSLDGGVSYSSTGKTSTNFTISDNSLPAGTNAVKITFSNSSNQVGIQSLSIVAEKSWSKLLLEKFTCSGVGEGSITAAKPASVWSIVNTAFSKLNGTVKETLKTKAANLAGTVDEQALARYDLVVRKYGTGAYTDFLGRFSEGGINYGAYRADGFNLSVGSDSSLPLIITIVAIGAVPAAGVFLFSRRRRDEK